MPFHHFTCEIVARTISVARRRSNGKKNVRPLARGGFRCGLIPGYIAGKPPGNVHMIRIFALLVSVLIVTTAQADERFIVLSSTTSTQDSGLFEHILPIFRAATGLGVHVVAVGTGHALAIGARGDADALLVHDRFGEDKFVADGFGIDRRDVMYNDFVIVGPNTDPAHIRGLKDARKALTQIAAAKARSASRGDDSGTNRMELRLWKSADIDVKAASGGWYKSLGQGMGPTLNTAAAMNAYTLADRATWSKFA